MVYVEKLSPVPVAGCHVRETPLPAYCSGAGQVLLAHLDWERVAGLLEAGECRLRVP